MLTIRFNSPPQKEYRKDYYRFFLAHDLKFDFKTKRQCEAFRGEIQKFYSQRAISCNFIYSNLLCSIQKSYPFMGIGETAQLKQYLNNYQFHFERLLVKNSTMPPKVSPDWNFRNIGEINGLHMALINLANAAFELADQKRYVTLKYELQSQKEVILSVIHMLKTITDISRDFDGLQVQTDEKPFAFPALKVA